MTILPDPLAPLHAHPYWIATHGSGNFWAQLAYPCTARKIVARIVCKRTKTDTPEFKLCISALDFEERFGTAQEAIARAEQLGQESVI